MSGSVERSGGQRRLRVYFIKPSQYDADGYVWQFRWGVVPNNTLTVLAGLNSAYAASRPHVSLETVLWEELVDGPLTPSIIESLRAAAIADDVEVIMGIAGVQTGQYCRGRDLALQLHAAGFVVVFGGFHVTGDAPSREFLMGQGITVVVGEAESTWPLALDDYQAGQLRPMYTTRGGIRARTGLGDITVPEIGNAVLPVLDARYRTRFFNQSLSTIDTSRGCPFACSYCAVKNVMGRTMRARSAEPVVEWMRDAYDRHGVSSWFIVDDDLYRSPQWEDVLGGLVELRAQGRDITFMMQCDVEAAGDSERARRFVELCGRAGCYSAFIGFESFNAANLDVTLKYQNEAKEDRRRAAASVGAASARVKEKYRRAVQRWHEAGVGVHAGYMIGLPFDGYGSGRQAARDLTDIGVDIASFFPYTPLPGTEDYDAALAHGEILDRDFNSWDCLHVVHKHPSLTTAEVYREYCEAHRAFYRWRRLAWSLVTYHGVPGLTKAARYGMLTQQLYYTYSYRRGWHPMMGGLWRVRDATLRRGAVTDGDAADLYRTRSPRARGTSIGSEIPCGSLESSLR